LKTSASDLPANLSAAKRLLLEKRLRGEKIGSSVPPLVSSPHAGAMLPLSYAQQRMWFIDQLTPGRSAYNIPGGMRLEGPLDIDALRKSLSEIVRRHESLRTRFVAIKGEPRQVVDEEVRLDLQIMDLSGTSQNERETEAKHLAREEARRPFDLEHGPLFRVKLLKLGERDHVLLVTMHHIVSDGWSTDILVREFAMLYGALSSGAPSPLPELSVQYADYAVWQRSWMKGSVLEDKLAYWKRQLAGVQTLELPTDRPRPAVQGQSGATLDFELDNQLTERMRELGRSQGATLYMVLMATLQLLIYRYSGHRDILVGSPVAGRIQRQIEGLIGLFVNTLVIRTTFQKELTFTELLGRVKKTTLEAFGHQDVPFEKLVDALQLERDLSRAPLFQVAFALQGAPPTFELGALQVKPFLIDNGTAKFDLTLMMGEGNTIQCWLEYNTELFDEASAMGMLHHFKTLLQQVTRNPQASIDAIPLLSETERAALLSDWHGDMAASPRKHTVSALVAAHAEATPNALALVSDGARLTYQELNQKAEELASRIHGLAGPGSRIGIFLERGIDQVVAALAVMKAGGIFVSLHTEEAPPRLRQIAADANILITITEDKFKEHLSVSPSLPLLLLDNAAEAQLRRKISETGPEPDSVACILFRSGAAGKPQGVLVTQQALCGGSFSAALDYKAEDRVALTISFSNEVGALHVFAAMAAGACVVNLAQTPALSPWEISKLLQEQRATVLCASAASLERMARSFSAGLKKLRLILCDDGPGIASRLPEKFRTAMGARAFAMYGSCETGKCPLLYSLRATDAIAVENVGINTRIYLLDHQLEPVPYGVAGQIFIGSDDLALGYEQLPGVTAEAFVPDPFSQVPGARLYRTGDWGRRHHDGRLQFLGRRDGRTTVRGVRIDTGEIESVLVQHQAVKEAAVLVREKDGFREPGIEIFAVLAEEKAVVPEELRRFLQERLPEPMLPSSITVVQDIPRTVTGSPDVRALTQKALEKKHVGPRNPIEEVLCGIWAQLLGREHVGVYDNFFEIGGDSILSVQVIAQARKAGVQITPKQMFEQQTIAGLAEVATVTAAETEVNEAETTMSGPVPVSPIQRLFFDWQFAHPEHFNQGVLLQIRSGADSEALEKAWIALLQHHDALRMRYEHGATGWKQICEDHVPEGTYRRKDFSKLAPHEQRTEVERDAAQVEGSFDLAAGRLAAAVEYDLGAENRRLLLAIHHLVVDGISWRILLEDLERGYEQLQAGESINLGRRTSSFKRWSDGLQRYSETEALRQEAAYWRQPRQSKPLPRDLSGTEAENTVESAKTLILRMEKEETQELLHDVPGVYHTQINDVLMTALARVLAEWSGGERVVVDLEGHGREELIPGADVSRTVGWFATIYPVTLAAGKRWEPGSALKAIKEQLRAVPNNGFGYGILRCIGLDEQVRRELAAMPGSEVLFNYLGQVDQIFHASRLFLPAQESPGSMSAPQNRRPYPLEVTAIVAGGQLQVSWTYSEKLHRSETIERIAQHYVECLREIMEHCRGTHAGGYTPSDFPLARLRQADLDKLVGRGEGIEDIYGLSPMQQGMLFHSLYESGSGVYFVQLACEVRGGMEASHFRNAWQSVVQRHKILRTEFLWEGLEEPVQMVRSDVDLWWREEDWRGLDAAEQQQRWQKFLKEDRQQGFDLHRAPLQRFARIQTGEDAYYFSWSTHHILMDGWCLQILLSEAIRIYVARCNGEEAELERPRPYRDYIRWLQQQDEKQAEKFWRRELSGFTESTKLRLEESIELPQGEEPYDQISVFIPLELTQKLDELARGHQITLNTVMQGAWAYLLSRYSGETDVVFGATVAGRSPEVEGIETMVGLFINALPARMRFQPDETVGAHLKRLQDQQAEARQYEYCPLMKVQAWSEIPRGASLFDTVLVFENFPVDSSLGDSIAANLKLGNFQFVERTNLPLFLKIVPGKEMLMVLTFDRRLFREETVARMLGHLNTVITGMAVGLQRKVAELSLLQESERQQVLMEWNRTEHPYPADKCVHELFAEHAAGNPGAIALEYQGQRLSYEDLDRRANQFAHYLRKLGVGQETRVAVFLERSADLVAALLGILKTGAAYVPLDPNYPAERLKYMLQDSQATAVLTRKALLAKLPVSSGVIIRIDEQRDLIEAESVASLPSLACPENLAYVMYTSGSTGTPKGIGGTHRGIVNRIMWMQRTWPMRLEDVCCQKTSLSFVDSVAEIFAPLLCGTPLMIVPDETARDAAELVRFLNARGVTRVVLVPSLLRTMLSQELGLANALENLRMVVTSGEALPSDLANLFPAAMPKAVLLNLYGSSEVAADATWFDLTHRLPSDPVLIGKPIANMRAYVLDEEMGPCPIGIAGELYVGGAGLARGYVNRGDLTAEKFVPDPFSRTGGERMYRTGDLARWRATGELEFAGRRDYQVKVRGHRIEMGEVEAALCADPAVAQAVVVARPGDPHEIQLVAYITPKEKTSAVALRNNLQQRVPDYMVPSALVIMETFPLTPSGKIDRRALPAPVFGNEGTVGYIAPRTPVEELLAQIWTEVLKVNKIGVNDHFFNMGGQSLLATQVVARISKVFGTPLELRHLFEAPTITKLAIKVEELLKGGKKDNVPAVVHTEGERAVPLSYAQQRLWFVEQLAPGSAYNIPAAVRLRGPLDLAMLGKAFEEIVKRHASLRTRFVIVNGEARQVVDDEAGIELPVVDLSFGQEIEQEAESKKLTIEEGRQVFDLRHAPLLRAKLLRLGSDHHVLLVTMHHIISDAWSMGILVQELALIYRSFVSGQPLPLPDLPIQYTDYSVWQRRWLTKEVLEEKLGYWRKQLAGMERLELPVDRPRPAVQTPNGANFNFRIPAELTSRLKELASREGATLYMLLLAAFQTLLYRYTRQTDVVIGSPIAGRTQKETEGLIGFFVNMLVLRADLSGRPGFVALLRRVKEMTLEAYAHQEVPFERLVEEFEPDRDLSRTPLFQVAFVLQNAVQSQMAFDETRLEILTIDNGTAKFDLTLGLGEDEAGMQGVLQYNTDLFEPATVTSMAECFTRLLPAIVENPEQEIDALPLIPPEERHSLAKGWSGAPLVNLEQTICERIRAEAEKNTAAVALIEEGVLASYGELNQRANQVAHGLTAYGVKGGDRVGICFEKGLDWVIAALGVLKAGAVMVPLDPAELDSRLTHILQDASVRTIITEEKSKSRFQQMNVRTVALEELGDASSEEPQARPEAGALACILYRTSATGMPQGILLDHGSLIASVSAQGTQIMAVDRVALLIDFACEVGGLEVFRTLATGACVVSIPRKPLPPRDLAALIRDHAATVLWAQAPMLEQLARKFPRAFKDLRLIFCEDSIHNVVRLAGALKPEMLLRLYGIHGDTESAGRGVAYQAQEMDPGVRAINMDRMPDGMTLRVLDHDLEPVAAGMVGEIFIGGGPLALGYNHQPKRSAESFIADPWSEASGQRLYRTGELARRRNDGRLELRGRCDGRLKISGQRVELREIEAALAQQPGIKDAAVLALETGTAGTLSLAAFIVAAEGAELFPGKLRQTLLEYLPERLAPADCFIVNAIPRSTSGRVEQRILTEKLKRKDYAAPKNRIEEILCGIWKRLLPVEQVGIHDNFFRLGGDSILSIQVITQAREAGIQITPRQMFERQTIAELAEVVTMLEETENEAEEELAAGPAPLLPIQRAFFEWRLKKPQHFNQALLLDLKPEAESALVEKTVAALLQHHDALRMSYELQDGSWQQSLRQEIPEQVYRRKNLSGLTPEEQRAELERDAERTQGSLELTGPLMRTVEYDLGPDRGRRLLLVIHHLVVDGISWRILLEDLERAYRQLKNQATINLGRKTTSTRRWAQAIERYAEQDTLKAEAEYWSAAPREQAKHIPCDVPAASAQANTAETQQSVAVSLEAEATLKLLQEVPKVYHTQVNDVLLAALGRACGEWGTGEHVLVDLEGHGREEIFPGLDISRTVGWFITIYPVLLERGPEQRWDPGALLKTTKEQLRAIPNRGFGYGVLRHVAQDESIRQRLEEMPQSDILFNYLGQTDQVFQGSELFGPARENSGRVTALENRRLYALEINAIVAEGRLQIAWNYSMKLHRRETIERVAQRYLKCLQEIIAHCEHAEAGGHTPSDFPFADFTQEQVDRWIGKGSDITDAYALTPMQEGMLFHSLYEPGSSLYFTQLACRIQGPLDDVAFRRAWEEVVQRHAVLRTSFIWEDLKAPVQVVHNHAELPWQEEDWRDSGHEEQQRKWNELLQQQRERGLDLLRAPLMRLALVRADAESSYFVWGFGHILMDGWCLQIVMGEVFRLYEAYRSGQKPELRRPPVFRDYIAWLCRQDQKKAEAFWRGELQGFRAPTRLRIERERRAGENGHEGHKQIRAVLGREATARLEELARSQQVTLNTVAQGAWSILLGRYSGDSDVVFGATVAGRSASVAGIEAMVGLFINTLPVRAQLRNEESVVEYLKRLQDRQANARDFEYTPLVKVQSWSEVPAATPLFESIMVFENYPVDAALQQQIGTQMKIDDVQIFNVTNYPLSLRITPAKELAIDLTYRTQIYDDKTAERLLGHLVAVLEQMGAGPERPTGQISLLMQDQYRQLLDDWNEEEETDMVEQ
jgi:amino acid adenylation domain-containing protein/non-ribosomal peptide synthase protein (TIGR01720 family)